MSWHSKKRDHSSWAGISRPWGLTSSVGGSRYDSISGNRTTLSFGSKRRCQYVVTSFRDDPFCLISIVSQIDVVHRFEFCAMLDVLLIARASLCHILFVSLRSVFLVCSSSCIIRAVEELLCLLNSVHDRCHVVFSGYYLVCIIFCMRWTWDRSWTMSCFGERRRVSRWICSSIRDLRYLTQLMHRVVTISEMEQSEHSLTDINVRDIFVAGKSRRHVAWILDSFDDLPQAGRHVSQVVFSVAGEWPLGIRRSPVPLICHGLILRASRFWAYPNRHHTRHHAWSVVTSRQTQRMQGPPWSSSSTGPPRLHTSFSSTKTMFICTYLRVTQHVYAQCWDESYCAHFSKSISSARHRYLLKRPFSCGRKSEVMIAARALVQADVCQRGGARACAVSLAISPTPHFEWRLENHWNALLLQVSLHVLLHLPT